MRYSTYLTRLTSGYWHYRLGPQRFIQWQIGTEPTEANAFHHDCTPEELREAAEAARQAQAGWFASGRVAPADPPEGAK